MSYTVTHWHCSSAARKGFLRTRYIRLAVPCHSFLASVGISQDEVRAPLKPLSLLDSGTPRLHINESLLQNKHGTIVHLKQHTANTTNPKNKFRFFFFSNDPSVKPLHKLIQPPQNERETAKEMGDSYNGIVFVAAITRI